MWDELRSFFGGTLPGTVIVVVGVFLGGWLGLYYGERMGWNDAVAVCVTAPADCKVR